MNQADIGPYISITKLEYHGNKEFPAAIVGKFSARIIEQLAKQDIPLIETNSKREAQDHFKELMELLHKLPETGKLIAVSLCHGCVILKAADQFATQNKADIRDTVFSKDFLADVVDRTTKQAKEEGIAYAKLFQDSNVANEASSVVNLLFVELLGFIDNDSKLLTDKGMSFVLWLEEATAADVLAYSIGTARDVGNALDRAFSGKSSNSSFLDSDGTLSYFDQE